MLQPQRCSSSPYPLHNMISASEDNHDFEELDPTGRYGRYKDVLGKGAFKIVYKGFDIVEGIEVAWNQIKVQNARHSSEDIERFYSEVHLLKTLKHKNIIKFYHSWVDTEAMNINFLTEIFTSGTLRQYGKRHKRIHIRALKKWSCQILRGLLYLHSQDPAIIHRDLKCDNIFINGNQGEVKIGDLGLATILDQAHVAHSVIGTPEFMAPELYEGEYTELVDIYSFGMCLLEMVTGDYPYSECANAAQIYKKVTSGKTPAALKKIKNPHLREFVENCIAPASRRLPARELLMDPFLQGDEVCNRAGETCSIYKASYGVKSLTGSFSDIQSSFMGRRLLSVESFSHLGSFSSLPDMCQECTLPSTFDHVPLSIDHVPSIVDHVPSTIDHVPSNQRTQQHNLSTSYLIEDKVGRKMEVQIKGKKIENGIIQLRLRIVKSEGQIRLVHFPFDVVHDTAMSVAREMITELDLVNQDVIRMAEIFDEAIGVLVPDWHTGLTTDNAICCSEDPRLVDVVNTEHNLSSEHLPSMFIESPLIDQSQNGSMSWQQKHSDAALKPSQMESTMHGRFEQMMKEPPLAGDECRAVTGTSSEDSWGALHSPSLGQSLDGECSFESCPFQEPLARGNAGVLGESTDLGLGNEAGPSQKRASHYGRTPDVDLARASDDYDYNLATWQLKELALQQERQLDDLEYEHEEVEAGHSSQAIALLCL